MEFGQIRKLLKESKIHIPIIWMGLSALMVGTTALSVSNLTGKLVNSVISGEVYWKELLFLILLCFIALIGYGIFNHYSFKKIACFKAGLSRQVYHSILFQKIETGGYKQGNVITNVLEDSNAITQFVEEELSPLFEFLLVSFFMGAATLYVDRVIFIVVLLLSMVSSISVFMSKKIQKIETREYQVKDMVNERVIDIYRAIPILSSIKNLQALIREIEEYINEIANLEVRKGSLSIIFNIVGYSCSIIRELVVIIYGIAFAGFDVGTVVAMLNITSFFNEIAQTAGELIMKLAKVSISARRLNDTFYCPMEEVVAVEKKKEKIEKIEFLDVTYLYDNVNGIDKFSATFERGKINMIVGEMGSGKSTIGKILCGLLEWKNGNIYMNGEKVSSAELRRETAYVDQEAVINFGTIAENVSSFAEKKEIRKVNNALKGAGLMTWVSSLPKGITTNLNAENLNLSGGQKQRISIARALYKDADVILLDEPTSALDAENESLIMETLYQMKDEKIIIVITHDKRMIKKENEYLKILTVGN